jgi:Phage integrase family
MPGRPGAWSRTPASGWSATSSSAPSASAGRASTGCGSSPAGLRRCRSVSKARDWPRPGRVSCAGRGPGAVAQPRSAHERAGPARRRAAPRPPRAGGRAAAPAQPLGPPGQRLPERPGSFFAAAPAGRPGGDCSPLHPDLLGREHALAPAAPPPCAQDPLPARGEHQEPSHQQDSGARRRRDAAFLAIAYGSGVQRAEAIALDLADLDFTAGQLRVRQGKGKKPGQAPLAPSAQPALEDWLQVRGRDPGPLFCAVSKTGRLAREGAGGLRRLSGSAAWAICKERGQKAGIQAPGSPRPAANLGR